MICEKTGMASPRGSATDTVTDIFPSPGTGCVSCNTAFFHAESFVQHGSTKFFLAARHHKRLDVHTQPLSQVIQVLLRGRSACPYDTFHSGKLEPRSDTGNIEMLLRVPTQ
eukprot:63924-Amphidinium_carterae.2